MDRTNRIGNRYDFQLHADNSGGSRILHRLVDSLTNFTNIPCLCAAIEARALNRRTCQYVYFHRLDQCGQIEANRL